MKAQGMDGRQTWKKVIMAHVNVLKVLTDGLLEGGRIRRVW